MVNTKIRLIIFFAAKGGEVLYSQQEEDITIINPYVPNIRAPQYVRQMLTSMIKVVPEWSSGFLHFLQFQSGVHDLSHGQLPVLFLLTV